MTATSAPESWRNHSLAFDATAGNGTSAFTPVMPPAISAAISVTYVVNLVITMASLGCTMELSKIKGHIVRPKGVAIALMAQYGFMPLIAFCLVKVFKLSEIRAVVVLICGCSPGGNLSNILSLGLHGDMNLSIVMTIVSNLLALGMMPLLLYLYCKDFPGLHTLVPYTDIVIALVMTLIPCGAGILFNHYRPRQARIFSMIGLWALPITVGTIGTLTSVGIGGPILTVLSPSLMAVGSLMPVMGYTFGYVLSVLFKLSQAEGRTVAMETGCQNIQLCSTILKLAFPPETIGILFIFPLVYAALQIIEASVLIVLYWSRRWLAGQRNGEGSTAEGSNVRAHAVSATYQPADRAESPLNMT
ncbi:hepatic sodium/bile acid cotransporter-like [Nelusetta ayraudi]|uniref:hepatic sodium/bile acid cotransporter-like n=1 Tax=Nelusetta ayraudi TaxID=303726 RepID=UPI003F723C83